MRRYSKTLCLIGSMIACLVSIAAIIDGMSLQWYRVEIQLSDNARFVGDIAGGTYTLRLVLGKNDFPKSSVRRMEDDSDIQAVIAVMDAREFGSYFIGFGFWSVSRFGTTVYAVTVKQWLIIALTLILPTKWLYLKLKQKKNRLRGHCPHCGYDLRASGDTCPECGHANHIDSN